MKRKSNFVKNNTMQSTIQYIRKELHGLYSGGEIESIIRHLFYAAGGYTLTDLVMKANEKLPPEMTDRIAASLVRLKQSEPVQYVTGVTEFYGLKIGINRHVLIPRPETEELVQWIVNSVKVQKLKILDVGSGSGCIALALKKCMPQAMVAGCDISAGAVAKARENATELGLDVRFFTADILSWESRTGWEKYDLIVSNPPYVPENELAAMDRNVVDYEPHGAIFVPDSDPLVFYRRIISFSCFHLIPAGRLFFEINGQYVSQISSLLSESGFVNIESRCDMNGKPRMVTGMTGNLKSL